MSELLAPTRLSYLNKEERRFTPIFRPVMFLVVFGVVSVLVASRTGGYALFYVRVASPLAQAASTQSQRRVGLEIASR